MSDPDHTSQAHQEPCELCIIGAGIAGLNALFVATQYLKKTDKVVLVDRRDGVGGMWAETYDFVRLHQPHEMFTVGNLTWDWDEPRDYLATGAEVLAHLQRCLGKLRAQVTLVEMYDTELVQIDEFDGGAKVQCRQAGASVDLVARRVIDARAMSIPVPQPLALSSDQVISTTPHLMQDAGVMEADAPVYVVGGGKTGMDTVLALLRARPGREVTLINGQGTIFAKRDMFLPKGWARWRRGSMFIDAFRDTALRYDGDNTDAVYAHFQRTYCISPDGGGQQFFFGLLSEDENQTIADGVAAIWGDYLEDVVDTVQGGEIVLRSGARHPIAPGSVIVNCTGHVMRAPMPYRPILSGNGAVLTISSRPAMHFLSSVSAYFLAHLFFRGRLADAGLYTMDMEVALAQGRKEWHMAVTALTFLNTVLLIQALPFKVLDQCGLDLDRWFPIPRRMAALIDIKLNQKRYIARCQDALAVMSARLGVKCGPLQPGAPET